MLHIIEKEMRKFDFESFDFMTFEILTSLSLFVRQNNWRSPFTVHKNDFSVRRFG